MGRYCSDTAVRRADALCAVRGAHGGTGRRARFFFFNDTAPTEISPLSLPDALPISQTLEGIAKAGVVLAQQFTQRGAAIVLQAIGPASGTFRIVAVSTAADSRLQGLVLPPAAPARSEEHTSESSHLVISYAVFCLKK